jgi:hypothetical protein
MTDREFVESVAEIEKYETAREIIIYWKGEPRFYTWAGAAQYFRVALEEIRQVKEAAEWVQDCIDMSGITEPEKGIPEQRFILALLRVHLETLSRGIKPEVLK